MSAANEIETTISFSVLPPLEITEPIAEIKKETGVYYPGSETSVPHVTLYSCKFDAQKYSQLLEKFKDFVSESFETGLTELQITADPKHGGVFAYFGFTENSGFIALHRRIVEIANPMRGDLIRAKDLQRYQQGVYSKEQFATIEKFGYEYVGERFLPHITVGTIKSEDGEAVQRLRNGLERLANKTFQVKDFLIKYTQRTLSDGMKVYESDPVAIKFKSRN